MPLSAANLNVHDLIAAAPEMYEALVEFPADADFTSSEEYARAISVWWSTKAMPALAKAEGRS